MEIRYWDSRSPFYQDKDTRDGYLWEPESALPLIRFHSLDDLDWLAAACSTRRGGVSTGFLAELNLGWSRGDVPENGPANDRRVVERMGFRLEDLALTHQVHGTSIVTVDRKLTVGPSFERKIRETDGLVCDQPGILLSATFADCVPVYLADPVSRQIALVHSGWKGTVGKIGEKAVELLASRGADVRALRAVIGPCISGGHYEVTGDVIEALSAGFSREEMADIALRTDEIHWLCDLPAACWHTLRKAGVAEENIHFSGICTWENDSLLFSHRKTGGRRGNFNAFMGIR